jgi:hypothetical protein
MNVTSNIWQLAFDACVDLLQYTAGKLDPYWPGGMDYVKINVILFCIVLPIILRSSLALNIALILALVRRG